MPAAEGFFGRGRPVEEDTGRRIGSANGQHKSTRPQRLPPPPLYNQSPDTSGLRTLVGRTGYLAADIPQLADGDVFETFAAVIKLFVDLDGRLLHDGVRVVRSSAEDVVLPAGQPGVAVVMVKGQPQQGG